MDFELKTCFVVTRLLSLGVFHVIDHRMANGIVLPDGCVGTGYSEEENSDHRGDQEVKPNVCLSRVFTRARRGVWQCVLSFRDTVEMEEPRLARRTRSDE